MVLSVIVGAGVVKGFDGKAFFRQHNGGANFIAPSYTISDGLSAKIVGTFILVYTILSTTDAKRSVRDSYVPVCSLLLLYMKKKKEINPKNTQDFLH